MENHLIPSKAVKQVGNGTAIVFAPHPDDEVLGCGGAIMRHRANGDPVHVIIVTDGGYQIGEKIDQQVYVECRQRESIKAAGILGYGTPVFWSLPDRGIVYGETLIQRVVQVLEEQEADIVYAPSVSETHPDHRVVGIAVAEAVRRCTREIDIAMYEIGIPIHPNLLLDITDFVDRKQEAIQCFVSQLKNQNYDQQISALNKYRTYTLPKTVRAAEAYLVKSRKETRSYLPEVHASEFEIQKELGLELDSEKSALVTVIIRSIGRTELLHEALGSVALQTYPNIEVLVVNAKGKGHPDIGEWCGHFPMRTCGAGASLGRSKACNVGLQNARGDYLIFLDEDDLFDPDHITNLVLTLEKYNDYQLAYAGVRVYREADGVWDTETLYNDPYDAIRLLCHNYIPLHAALFNRKLVTAGCAFDENLSLCEDWDFWIQVAEKTDFIHINHVSATYRISHSDSNIWGDQELAENATIKILDKWQKVWSTDQLFKIASYAGDLYKKTAQIGLLEIQIQEQSLLIAERDSAIAERDSALAERDSALAERDSALAERDSALAERNTLQHDLLCRDTELAHVYKSISWRLTKPLRMLRRDFITKLAQVFRGLVLRVIHLIRPKFQSKEPELSNYVPLLETTPLAHTPVQLIAFYLPQFHPILENNEWWGEGFTEWTNVQAAEPQFAGHDQPHVPGELGYYDLRNPDVQRRQVELAKLYGIGGFCFYFYWFAGKRLLETPILQYLEDTDIDFPFCLCWANENWTRRWDGLENEILIGQKYSDKDDLVFIKYISKYFKDSRYIKINNKPLLVVYRPGLLPSAKKTAKRWRKWCLENGIGEIYLAYTQSFDVVDPKEINFDAAIEFPPNNMGPPSITDKVDTFYGFDGVIYDWQAFPERSKSYKNPDYKLFRGVNPSWDNTARRKKMGTILLNTSPGGYQEWLQNAAKDTIARFDNKQERLVFVNAWNEWAEGACLEPDQKYGYAYLQATRDALEHIEMMSRNRRIVLVSHDAHPHGAQNLILHMAKMLNEDFRFIVDMVVLGDGPLLDEYARYTNIHMIPGNNHCGEEARELAADLFAQGHRSAICNTTVAGLFVGTLKEQGFKIVSLVHELQGVIEKNKLQSHVISITKHADHIVFPAKQVQYDFDSFTDTEIHHSVIRPQGLYKKNLLHTPEKITDARIELRKKLNIPENSRIILSIAYGDHRKGIDLFVDMALNIIKKKSYVYFVWVGRLDPPIESNIQERIDRLQFSDRFILAGMDFQTDIYYAGSDIYALTSREDPFPSVVLEALDIGIPVVAFDSAGGFTELLSRGCGSLVPAFDTQAYSDEIIRLLGHPETMQSMSNKGKEIVENEFSFRHYLFDLIDLSGVPIKRVSVVVPNFNYARYLSSRITSIVQQHYPVYELIILDDASTDESVDVLVDLLATLHIDCKFVRNEHNSGNPFVQWYKGVEMATGDYIWIAEADDLAGPEFLVEVLKPFDDQSVVMSYCQSRQIDSDDKVLCEDYQDYVSDISSEKWLKSYIEDGEYEICTCFSIKNTIPNVSAVIFRREILLNCLEENLDEIKALRVSGDWLTYLYVLSKGKIAFSPNSLNSHRRHQDSVTISSFDLSQLQEIVYVQKKARNMFPVDNEALEKAESYSQYLYEHFGLATKEAPKLSNHPELSDIK